MLVAAVLLGLNTWYAKGVIRFSSQLGPYYVAQVRWFGWPFQCKETLAGVCEYRKGTFGVSITRDQTGVEGWRRIIFDLKACPTVTQTAQMVRSVEDSKKYVAYSPYLLIPDTIICVGILLFVWYLLERGCKKKATGNIIRK